jgi:DNA-binding NtrC family response regulator
MRAPESLIIFLVDDDPFFQSALKQFLSLRFKDRVNLRVFPTAEQCGRYLEQCSRFLFQKPDLIFLDYMLSPEDDDGMSGLDLLPKIRASHPDIPVVMISGKAGLQEAVQAIKGGAYDFMVKNQVLFENIEKLIKEATESVSFFGKACNSHFWLKNKKADTQHLSWALNARSRIFFSPFELPPLGKTPIPIKKKKKSRARLVH